MQGARGSLSCTYAPRLLSPGAQGGCGSCRSGIRAAGFPVVKRDRDNHPAALETETRSLTPCRLKLKPRVFQLQHAQPFDPLVQVSMLNPIVCTSI